ncbi:MAG TPA: hypothetical protein VFA51_10755 [Candidatus Udaeobacter sp.]|nr:hypothetical protein [Candidatus Udaeobacter sp.]
MTKNDEALMRDDEIMTKSQSNSCGADDAFWNEGAESLVREEAEAHRVYDLEERTARFGEVVIDFAKTIPHDAITNRLISQLVGAATSVGGQLCRSRRCSFKEGFFEEHRDLPKRSARNKTLSSHDRPSCAGIKIERSYTLAGSQGATSDFLEDLEKRQK